jgi:ATP-dependent DNA ligase
LTSADAAKWNRRAPLAAALDGRPAALDGEIVFYNEASQIDFGLL